MLPSVRKEGLSPWRCARSARSVYGSVWELKEVGLRRLDVRLRVEGKVELELALVVLKPVLVQGLEDEELAWGLYKVPS